MNIYCERIGSRSGSSAAYALLAAAYRSIHGEAMPEIKKTPNGKPYFAGGLDIHFSLSHSKTHILCAISDAPIGVDIESPRCISERAVKYFSSPAELSMFSPLELWVLKESYVKLVGGTLPLVRNIRYTHDNESIKTSDLSAFSKLYCIEGCHAAVSTYKNNFPESINTHLLTR